MTSHEPVQKLLYNSWTRTEPRNDRDNNTGVEPQRLLPTRFVQGFGNLDLQGSFASSVSFKSAMASGEEEQESKQQKQAKKEDIYGYNSKATTVFSENLTAKDILEAQSSDLWHELDSHILSISNDIFDFQPKQIVRSGSKVYNTVLEEERKRRKARAEGFRKAMKLTRASLRVNDALQQTESNPLESDEDSNSESKTRLRKSRSRGWIMLRRFVQEQRLQKKLQQELGGWNLVSKTMQHLTNAESGRQELYHRYLERPNSWREGLASYQQYRYIFEDSGWKRRQRELLERLPQQGTAAFHSQSIPQRSKTACSNQKRVQSTHRKSTGIVPAGKRLLQRPHTVCR